MIGYKKVRLIKFFRRIFFFINILSLFFLIFSNFSCKKSEEKISKVRTIKNSEEALKPSLKIGLKEVMSLHEDWFDYGLIFLDKEENIVYWQERDNIACKFDSKGGLLLKKKFMKGRGFGDVDFFDFDEYGGRFYVFDKGTNCRLNIFDKELNLIKVLKMRENYGKAQFQLRINQDGDLHYIFEEWKILPGGSIDVETGVANYGKDGEKKKIVFFKETSPLYPRESDGKMVSHYFLQPFLRYLVDEDGKVWICDMREYRIYIFSLNGELEKVIEKKYRKIELKGEIKEEFMREYRIKKEEEMSMETILPEYVYPLMDLLLIEGRYLLVLRSDYIYKKDKKGKILADLFSAEGEFLNQVELPEFYACFRLSNQFKSNICYKNGFLYILETDEEGEKFWIKKYQLKIEE